MIWNEVSPDIWTANYCGWSVTAILEYRDAKGEHYTYIAVKDQQRFASSSWSYLRSKILRTRQLVLFP